MKTRPVQGMLTIFLVILALANALPLVWAQEASPVVLDTPIEDTATAPAAIVPDGAAPATLDGGVTPAPAPTETLVVASLPNTGAGARPWTTGVGWWLPAAVTLLGLAGSLHLAGRRHSH